MYFDLFVPFPLPEETSTVGKKKDKGKGKANQQEVQPRRSCWDGLSEKQKDGFARSFAMAGHRGSPRPCISGTG